MFFGVVIMEFISYKKYILLLIAIKEFVKRKNKIERLNYNGHILTLLKFTILRILKLLEKN